MRNNTCKSASGQFLTFGKRFLATRGLGEELLALGDGFATETDTLLRVEDGTLPDEALDATGTTVDLVESDLVDNLGTMLPIIQLLDVDSRGLMGRAIWGIGVCALAKSLDLLDLLGKLLSEALLQGLAGQ